MFGFPGYLWPWNAIYMLIAIGTWLYLQPALERCVAFRVDWIAEMYRAQYCDVNRYCGRVACVFLQVQGAGHAV